MNKLYWFWFISLYTKCLVNISIFVLSKVSYWYYRWFVHEDGDGNHGRIGLVPGPAGDDSDSSVGFRHGFVKGKFTSQSSVKKN